MTKAEKEHYAKLARLGCILCRQIDVRNIEDSPTEIHHIRRYGGKRSLAPTIPLCAWHHRLDSRTSIHGLGHKGFTKFWGFSEEDLLEKTKQLLNDNN
jgi:hypothetical protein